MYDTQEQTNTSIWGTSFGFFLIGAAVGAGVALIYAPAAGRETRSQIADQASRVKNKFGELRDTAVAKVGQWKDMAMDTAETTIDRAAETVRDMSDGASNLTTAGRGNKV